MREKTMLKSIEDLKEESSIVLNTHNLSSVKSTISRVKRFTNGSYIATQLEDLKIKVERTKNQKKRLSWTKKMRYMLVGQTTSYDCKNHEELRKMRATASNLKSEGVIVKITSNKLSALITREL